jgi:hypothetical protein
MRVEAFGNRPKRDVWVAVTGDPRKDDDAVGIHPAGGVGGERAIRERMRPKRITYVLENRSGARIRHPIRQCVQYYARERSGW